MPKKNNLINISKNPFFLFKKWFDEACKTELNDPNAMNLSTVSEDLKPSSRMVLLKNFDINGFVFYTNINSKKGKSILKNPNVALNFHWKSILRQIRIEGKISNVSDKESNDYFDTRHIESRIGAWASKQSSELKNRKNLKDNLKYYKEKFKNKDILRPPHWRGFRVEPNLIEFWQDMPFRLHDRVEYSKIKNKWIVKKLYP
jgi:pyridoxamine 5'-phosphate oxidase